MNDFLTMVWNCPCAGLVAVAVVHMDQTAAILWGASVNAAPVGGATTATAGQAGVGTGEVTGARIDIMFIMRFMLESGSVIVSVRL